MAQWPVPVSVTCPLQWHTAQLWTRRQKGSRQTRHHFLGLNYTGPTTSILHMEEREEEESSSPPVSKYASAGDILLATVRRTDPLMGRLLHGNNLKTRPWMRSGNKGSKTRNSGWYRATREQDHTITKYGADSESIWATNHRSYREMCTNIFKRESEPNIHPLPCIHCPPLRLHNLFFEQERNEK